MSETLTICHDWHDGTTLHDTAKDTEAHRTSLPGTASPTTHPPGITRS